MTSKTLIIPTLKDIEEAKTRISKYLLKTPLIYSPGLSRLTGAEVYIKYENHNPTGAFKVRGGINLVSKLMQLPQVVNSGQMPVLLAGSTGNHGQSISYAGKLFGFKVVIIVPEKSNLAKVQAMKALGAEVILHGKDVCESWEYCEKLSEEGKYHYVHSVIEPDLFTGVGTIGLEVYEDLPEVDFYITAVGGGSGICGASIALKSKNPKIKTYGVQASGASAVYDSFKQRKIITHPNLNTFAEGLATRSTYDYAYNIMQKYVDDMFLVDDNEMKEAILLYLEHCKTLAEGAGAASLAGLLKNKATFIGKKVVCVLTGGNLRLETLKEIMKTSIML